MRVRYPIETNSVRLLVGVAEIVSPGVHQLEDGRVIQEPITGNVGAELESKKYQWVSPCVTKIRTSMKGGPPLGN